MSEFKVTEVAGFEDWGDDGQYGPKRTYKIVVFGDQGRLEDGEYAELVQKRDSPAPTVGQTLYGELTRQNGRWKFKKDKPAFGGGGGQSFSRSPDQQKQIIQQSCLKVAVEYLKAKVLLKKMEDFTVDDVDRIATAFRERVEGVS
jgi:hypothetical protein